MRAAGLTWLAPCAACRACSSRSSVCVDGGRCDSSACGAWLAGGGAPGPGLPTGLHTALMLKTCPPLARPGLPSLAATAGSGAPSLPPARGAAPGSACPAPAAGLGVADQVRRAPWVAVAVGSSCCITSAAPGTLPFAPASAAVTSTGMLHQQLLLDMHTQTQSTENFSGTL